MLRLSCISVGRLARFGLLSRQLRAQLAQRLSSSEGSAQSHARVQASTAAAAAEAAGGGGGEQAHQQGGGSQLKKLDYDEQDDYEFEEPKTFGEKVKFYGKFAAQMAMMVSLVGLAGYMAYELLFSGVSPTKLYDDAFAKLQYNEAVIAQITGEDMRCYGRGGSESRRNQVDSFSYTEEGDRPPTRRTRIRFNIEGKKGKALVFAEVADRLPEGERFVYLICQDRRTGRVLTVVDNRDKIEALAREAGEGELTAFEKAKNLVGGVWK